eukprot:13064230-Alexandrium_andersonii.AAC.1
MVTAGLRGKGRQTRSGKRLHWNPGRPCWATQQLQPSAIACRHRQKRNGIPLVAHLVARLLHQPSQHAEPQSHQISQALAARMGGSASGPSKH